MSDQLIISVSGLRGIVGDTLTPGVAARYAAAFAEVLPPGPVVVTRDGRANGGALVPAVVAGLAGDGSRKVLDGGIAATPTTGVLVTGLHCAGGVQISASHNPAEYNGMKLFSAEGRVVPSELGGRVLERFNQTASLGWHAPEPPAKGVEEGALLTTSIAGSTGNPTQSIADTTSAHLALVERIVDVSRIRTRRFRVLLDANHGSGSVLGRPLLQHLGCDVTLVGGEPDGHFFHPPEPTAENLAGVLADVTRVGADIGFCQDPDADRLAIIDERGRYIGEEYTLALCVDHVLRNSAGPIVTNCSTSRMTEDLARKYGAPFYRSAVGEANVVDMMLRHDAVLGGEGNGGVIDPRVGLVRDSFVGMALVLDAMAARELPVSALAVEMPRYAICKTKIELATNNIAEVYAALERRFSDATADRLDGLRLDWFHADGGGNWLLVRPSNTEPIVRVIAESPTHAESARLCDDAASEIAALR
ncbi:MAG TPA: phosphoglucosamine mutase [Pirellulales bacterium]|nr:phosphoglucosamine mutase [Pirellulales bacterium]